MTDKQFEQIEYLSKKLWEDINNGHEYSMVTYTEFLGIVTEVWEKLQEEPVSKQKLSNVERTVKNWKEPVSEELEEASKHYALNNTPWDDCKDEIQESFKAGAKWQKENLWMPANGDYLPDIDREVIALLDSGKVVFAHRPPEFWDGKDIVTGKVTRNYPKTYDKGGWNIPNIVYWLDVKLPKEIEL